MAVDDAHVFPGFLTPVLPLLPKATDYFSHMLQQTWQERRFASAGHRTHNQKVMNPGQWIKQTFFPVILFAASF